MKEREQKIFDQSKTCPEKNRTESDGYAGGQTFMWITENNLTDNDPVGYGLLEFILSPSNLNAAYLQVRRNKGSGGVDQMQIESLKDYLVNHKDGLITSIRLGKYCPNPVRRVEISKESAQKLKAKIKELTSRSNGWGHDRRKEALRQYIIGWVHYFKLADMVKLLIKVDEWYRRRLRMVIWSSWKRVRTKLSNLIKLGVSKAQAWEWANTRKGLWCIANSFILSTTITTDRLRHTGYVFFWDYYRKIRVVN